MSVLIRGARAMECGAIQRVLHLAHRVNFRKGYRFPAAYVSRKLMARNMRRFRYFVLLYNNRVIGTVALKRRRLYWEVGSLAVLPQLGRRRFGTQLLRFVEARARRMGIRRLVLHTFSNHHYLPGFYIKMGYRRRNLVILSNLRWLRMSKNI